MSIRNAMVKLGPIVVEAGILGAVEDEGAGLVSVCTHGQPDGKGVPAKIKRRDYCPVPECDNDDKTSFRKGRVIGSGIVLLDPAALAALAVDETLKKMITLTVHPADEMAAAFPSGKSYYLEPKAGSSDNYALIAALLTKRPDLAFVGEFSFSGPAALYQVLVSDGVLTLRQLSRPDLVRQRPAVAGEVNASYLTLAEEFAEAICATYEPAQYRDRRREALARLVEAGSPVALADTGVPAAASTTTTKLGDALRASLKALAPAAPAPAAKTARSRAAKTTAAKTAAAKIAAPARKSA